MKTFRRALDILQQRICCCCRCKRHKINAKLRRFAEHWIPGPERIYCSKEYTVVVAASDIRLLRNEDVSQSVGVGSIGYIAVKNMLLLSLQATLEYCETETFRSALENNNLFYYHCCSPN